MIKNCFAVDLVSNALEQALSERVQPSMRIPFGAASASPSPAKISAGHFSVFSRSTAQFVFDYPTIVGSHYAAP